MTAGNVDIQKAIQDAVDELDSNSRKSSGANGSQNHQIRLFKIK